MLYLKDENNNVLHTFTRREIRQIVNALSDGESLEYLDVVYVREFGRADARLEVAQDKLYKIGNGTNSWLGALAIAQLIGLGFKFGNNDES